MYFQNSHDSVCSIVAQYFLAVNAGQAPHGDRLVVTRETTPQGTPNFGVYLVEIANGVPHNRKVVIQMPNSCGSAFPLAFALRAFEYDSYVASGEFSVNDLRTAARLVIEYLKGNMSAKVFAGNAIF
jgi:hypothetical protein